MGDDPPRALVVTGAIEIARADKEIGSSLEAHPAVFIDAIPRRAALDGVDFAEVCITSDLRSSGGAAPPDGASGCPTRRGVAVVVERAPGVKCARSWRYFDPAAADPDYPDVTPRDAQALRELKRRAAGMMRAARARRARRSSRSLRSTRRRNSSSRMALAQRSRLAAADAVSRSRAALEPRHFVQSARATHDARHRPAARLHLRGDAALASWLWRTHHAVIGLGLGAIIGGAIGNAVDRLSYGAVVDFLDLHPLGRHFFVFNVADAAINVGVIMLIVDGLFAREKPETAAPGG